MIELQTEGRVLHLVLNRPERRNALTLEACKDLVGALEKAQEDAGVGCVVLKSAGPAFCSGMDLEDAMEADPDELAAVHDRLFTAIAWMRKPLIAAVQGAAIAGGMGLVANAHLAIADENARFGLTEIRVGLWPVAIYRALVLAVGHRRAAAWSISGQLIDAAEALGSGLVTALYANPVAEAEMRAQQIAAYSANVLAAGLEYAERVRTFDWEQAGTFGCALRARLTGSADFREGVAAFQQKRVPVWPSRRAENGVAGCNIDSSNP